MICNVQALFMIYIIQNDKPYCTSSLFVYIASGALSAGTDRVALGMASINYYSLDSFGATLTASKTALPSTPVLNCGYGVFSDKEIILTTSTEPNSVVANILVTLREQRRRRRRQEDCPYDLPPVAHLTMQSPAFYLDNTTFSKTGLSSWLVTKTCVYVGYSEVLEIWLRNKDDLSKIYGYKNITIKSRPTPPNFLPPEINGTVDISFCNLARNLTIVSANNDGSCLSWSCSVRCTNSSELFWVVDGITVMASGKYIQTGQTYELIVACNETASNLQGSIHESLDTLMVRFSRNCPTKVSSALTQILSSLRSTTMSTKSTTSITKPVSNQTVLTVSMYKSATTENSRKTRFAASVSAQILHSLRSTTMSSKSTTSVAKHVSNQTAHTDSMHKSATTALSRKSSFTASVSAQMLPSFRLTRMLIKSTTSVIKQVSNQSIHPFSMYTSARTDLSRKKSFTASAVLATSPLTAQTLKSDILKPDKKIGASWTVTEQTQGYSSFPVVPKCIRDMYKGFFDDPRRMAAIATTGGIILGIVMTVGYVIMSSRFKLCLCLPSMVSPAAEETQKPEDLKIDSTSNVS